MTIWSLLVFPDLKIILTFGTGVNLKKPQAFERTVLTASSYGDELSGVAAGVGNGQDKNFVSDSISACHTRHVDPPIQIIPKFASSRYADSASSSSTAAFTAIQFGWVRQSACGICWQTAGEISDHR